MAASQAPTCLVCWAQPAQTIGSSALNTRHPPSSSANKSQLKAAGAEAQGVFAHGIVCFQLPALTKLRREAEKLSKLGLDVGLGSASTCGWREGERRKNHGIPTPVCCSPSGKSIPKGHLMDFIYGCCCPTSSLRREVPLWVCISFADMCI